MGGENHPRKKQLQYSPQERKEFPPGGTGCLAVRPRLEIRDQQNHHIPQSSAAARLGKGSRILRRPRFRLILEKTDVARVIGRD